MQFAKNLRSRVPDRLDNESDMLCGLLRDFKILKWRYSRHFYPKPEQITIVMNNLVPPKT
jgi:hypothetical protein